MPDREQLSQPAASILRFREKVDQSLSQILEEEHGLGQTRLQEPLQDLVVSPLTGFVEALQQAGALFSPQVQFEDIGTVRNVGDGVASLSGLPRVHTDELVIFPTGVTGLVFSLNRRWIDVILLGADEGIRGGDQVRAAGERLRIPVGPNLLGRVVNPLGEPLDGGKPIEPSDLRFLERESLGVTARTPIHEPLQTGWKVIDALLPIGRGQRELIVGDRQIGKTTLALDTIINQKGKDVACIYVAIGQKKSSTLAVINRLREEGALEHTTVVLSTPDDPPALRYLAPYAGCTIAEYLLDQGRDTLVVYDDLSKHANAYRELSLLLRRPPGREAYPGDIFYLHSRLLERACKLNKEHGGGSMTALPIVEIQRGNLSAFIPTNLISITDGQIVLDTNLFNQGVKPAVQIGLSVSRVGGAAQTQAMKRVASELRLQLSQYEEVSRFARFGTDVDEATQQQINQGQRLLKMLTQPPHTPLSLVEQITILLAAREGHLEKIEVDSISSFETALFAYLKDGYDELLEIVEHSREINDETYFRLSEAIHEFVEMFTEGSMDV
ncbi:MAG: F0F1 ATP synthase subunit alpha [Anaerolineales bacterium]|nr:F0F1 ATP synthase subunit alpha [Anaerolineales bacterium]